MISPHVFHEDVFYEHFIPYRHPEAHHEVWGGHGLETFGNDLDVVRRHDPAYLWTVLDGESGKSQWIVPGFHYVNRVCYIVTKIPHNSIHVEFRVNSRMRSMTKLGLKRQTAKMLKLLSQK